MSDPVIRVENLGKKYIIGHQQQERYTSLRDVITNKVKSFGSLINPQAKKENPAFEEFWALNDVSFDIKQGDRVGIIGRNGSGKSTLLKILSRITEPTTGSIKIKGRVASLLEVGTGFHPELTGRENIFLNGAILGMGKKEIKRKFDEIVTFAEVEKFLDTPVKRYSSGMYVRLAFAVAAHLEPEILIVDEVLAVGDSAFQKKCLGKMEDVGKEGRTVLFVSHNMAAISRLCNQAVLLQEGKIIKIGTPEYTIGSYLDNNQSKIQKSDQEFYVSSPEIDVFEFQTVDSNGKRKTLFKTSDAIIVIIKYFMKSSVKDLRIGFDLYNSYNGDIIFRTFDDDSKNQLRETGTFELQAVIYPNLLKPGLYKISLQIRIHAKKWITNDSIYTEFSLDLGEGINDKYSDRRPGIIMPKIDWILEKNHNFS